MRKIKYYSYIGLTFFKLNVQSTLEYPAFLLGWLLSNPLQFLFGFISIRVIVSSFQPLGGWGFEQLAFLYGLGIISHGISIVLFIQTWYMGYLVTEGGFDRMILRPLNVFFQFCFMDFNFIGFTDMLPGIVIFVYACIAASFQFTLASTISVLLTLIGATLIRGGIYTLSGSLSFWSKRSGGLIDINLGLFDISTKYPLNIYPKMIQMLFTFVFPIGFITFYSADRMLDMNTGFTLPMNMGLLTLFVGVAVYSLSMLLFRIGLRRYESAGS